MSASAGIKGRHHSEVGELQVSKQSDKSSCETELNCVSKFCKAF